MSSQICAFGGFLFIAFKSGTLNEFKGAVYRWLFPWVGFSIFFSVCRCLWVCSRNFLTICFSHLGFKIIILLITIIYCRNKATLNSTNLLNLNKSKYNSPTRKANSPFQSELDLPHLKFPSNYIQTSSKFITLSMFQKHKTIPGYSYSSTNLWVHS